MAGARTDVASAKQHDLKVLTAPLVRRPGPSQRASATSYLSHPE